MSSKIKVVLSQLTGKREVNGERSLGFKVHPPLGSELLEGSAAVLLISESPAANRVPESQ